ncbi:MAG TPA: energy transducer TonB [Methylococcaceae bacterium]|nr:energy transducer TonB [Methylococcaceae bacterium]
MRKEKRARTSSHILPGPSLSMPFGIEWSMTDSGTAGHRRLGLTLALSISAHLVLFAWFAAHQGTTTSVMPHERGHKRTEIVLLNRRAVQPLTAAEAPRTQSAPPSQPVISAKSATKRTDSIPHKREPKPAKPKPNKPVKEAPLIPFIDEFPELSHTYTRESLASRGVESPPDLAGSEDVGIHPGSILNINPKIIYPRQAIQQRHQGVVVVLIHIAKDGHCDGADLLQSSGHAELDDQVLGAVQHWRFIPPRRGQMPVEATYKHTVIFGADERAFDDFEAHWHEIRVMPAP